ncbi:fibroblast growth factor-binding protein 1-like [Menidia menidia]
MFLLRTLALWLLLALSLSSGQRAPGRPGGRAQRSGGKGALTSRGKFSTGDHMQCAWNAREVRDAVKMRVTCENPKAKAKGELVSLTCEYNAKTQSCQRADPKGFWKQVSRALRRLQGKLCRDELALVKTGTCKRAPQDAHFKLDARSVSVSHHSQGPVSPSPPPGGRSTPAGPTRCSKSDHRHTAQEYCSSSWASVCSFFLSMLQSEDC